MASPPRGARSGGHDSCQAARTAATCTWSRGGARCHGAALSASKFRRGSARHSAATSIAAFLVNCSSTKGDIYVPGTYTEFLFHFPFDDIYRRLLFFTVGRSVSAWVDYSTTKWKKKRTAGWSCSVFFFFFFQLSCESYMVMDAIVQNPQKGSGYDQRTTMRKPCKSWLQDVLLLSFLLWCSDDRRKNTRTGTPWCIADWLLQVLRSRLITTNYCYLV